MKQTDTTFFTNEEGASLLDRFKKTLPAFRFLDILVGYFRASGFHQLCREMLDIEKIRVLVGINIDGTSYKLVEQVRNAQSEFTFSHSHDEAKINCMATTIKDFDDADELLDIERGARMFIEFLQSKKMEIRVYPYEQIHAKVYVGRFPDNAIDYGRVITGSSNFSQSGLKDNLEFNVELKQSGDVKYALECFERLWSSSTDVSQDFVETLSQKTWLNDGITPFELFLKTLYEYFKEDIDLDKQGIFRYPEGFMELEYQKQAATGAQKILNAYGGVFISDVVGLGKTYMSALLAQQLIGRKMIICPPILMQTWESAFHDFGIFDAKIFSVGKLDDALQESKNYEHVFIDEAHRFRNENTTGYETLKKICAGKNTILVSATPLNNRYEDLLSQIKLFQPSRNSEIPGIRDLENFFASLEKKLKEHDRKSLEYAKEFQRGAQEIRDKILRHVMVRRTRSEIVRFYGDDIAGRGLAFPQIKPPLRVIYRFSSQLDVIFKYTLNFLRELNYSRYQPLLYLVNQTDQLEIQRQKNIGAFMKGLLVKRLESSFYAFRATIERFISSYEKFIEMFDGGAMYIGKNVDVFDLINDDNIDEINRLLDENRLEKYEAKLFSPDFRTTLDHDLQLLIKIEKLWSDVSDDPKLDALFEKILDESVRNRTKLIIFTESKETGEYLYEKIEQKYPSKTICYSSNGGIYANARYQVKTAREMIRANFDPRAAERQAPESADDVLFLLTTDTLAEGVNLHRAATIVNYDLPWNPTKILQRVGRVNRVGTAHDEISIINFFPTDQSEGEIGLETAVKAKIQAFHDTLGEDAKYITEEEETGSYGLFGDRHYETINDAKSYEGERDENDRSELEFLKIIRDVRDNEPQLFERISKIPTKARSGIFKDEQKLLTFFRKGGLKKFFVAQNNHEPTELTFLEAAELLRCDADEPRPSIPDEKFYELLAKNKFKFDSADEEAPTAKKGTRNEHSAIAHIKAVMGSAQSGEREFLYKAIKALEANTIPSGAVRKFYSQIKNIAEPNEVIKVTEQLGIRRFFDEQSQQERKHRQRADKKTILSCWVESKR